MTHHFYNDTWQRLIQHAKHSKNLQALFNDDNMRAQKFCAQACKIYIDYSKQFLDNAVLNDLLLLAKYSHLAQKIDDLFLAKPINHTEKRPALHTALRAPKGQALWLDGVDINAQVHQSLEKACAIAEKIASKVWRGFSGRAITDVVNIGVGGSDLGPLMASGALAEWAICDVRVHFVSNMDGTQLHHLLLVLNPETTVFIISSKSFSTVDTLSNANTARAWLQNAHDNTQTILKRHFIGISANKDKMHAWGICAQNQLALWDWVGGRFSMWSAIGLALAIKIGKAHFYELLAGAHEMDVHFKNTPFAQNLPVLLGLIAVYNSTFLRINAHSILPYDGRLRHFPSYLTQLEMESGGKSTKIDGTPTNYATCPILWGEVGSNAQHAFYQLLHQGSERVSCDFIMSIRRYDDTQTHNPLLLRQHQLSQANCLAQSKVLAFGDEGLVDASADFASFKQYRGNQPSSTILLDTLTPKSLGSLIALYEHKVFVTGVLWQINSFDQWGVEMGKVVADSVLDALLTQNTNAFDASTNALLQKILHHSATT